MREKSHEDKSGAWIIRKVPGELMRRTRMAALAERRTVRALIMDVVEGHLQELEKKGILPKLRA